ncbi:hypothetical protein HN709_00280 [Candidatus Peregrinibacteria bacterium]|nr:hypothetical protein [Candidatus Peregrinibacteria bacterium]MBT7736106.1 hypothetical protein [Candidatus Peregrinibacteria bacterium]
MQNKIKGMWPFELIKEGCDKFYNENDRYPTSHDFDLTEYLPSSVTIRKRFGSFAKFRKLLGQDIKDYTKGPARSNIVRALSERAIEDENLAYEKLRSIYGEMHVHREKEYAFRNRVDFYIYFRDGFFAIDTFYPKHARALPNIFNIKEKKYINFPGVIYLVVMNKDIEKEVITKFLGRRKKETPSHIKLVLFSDLDEILKGYAPIQ